ncbi:MAG: MFS transporter [Alphaproteobacteria bacterium]|nr:MFS transporter [Alphaproteobacteria bacterium]
MRSSYWIIIIALLIAEIAAVFETTMIYVALPTLIREFGDPVTAGWLVTSHGLIGTSVALMAGRLGDIYGRKRVLLVMLVVAIVGSVLSAVTTDYMLVLLGRSLQGCATALIPLSIGILRETLPKERVPVAIGLMTTGMGMGTATGLVLGGWIIDNFPWHTLFAVSAAMLTVAWIVIKLLIPGNKGVPQRTPIDWVEGLLPVPGITAVLLGISFSKDMGWLNGTVIGLMVLGFVIIALWARRSFAAEEPFINLRLLASRNVSLAILIAVLLSLGTMQITLVFSAYAQNPLWTAAGLGVSATVAGLLKLPSNVLSFFAGPFSGWLQQKRGIRLPILSAGLIGTAGWVAALAFPTSAMQVIVLLCVISFGTTMLNAAIPNVIVASVPEERTSEAIGALSVLRGMAQSIGSQVIAVMLSVGALLTPEGGARIPSPTGFTITMATIAGLTLAAALVSFLLRSEDEPGPEPVAVRA